MSRGRMFIDQDAWDQLAYGLRLEPAEVRIGVAYRALWCFSVEFCRTANKG